MPNADMDTPDISASVNLTEQVIQTARQQLGKPYKIGTEGPLKFDCSGLVWYCFYQNGVDDLIGGERHRANWYMNYFMEKGLFVPSPVILNAKRGDLVVYGNQKRATHIGIYLGGNKRRIISALINPFGVSRTRFNAIEVPVLGYCNVQYPTE